MKSVQITDSAHDEISRVNSRLSSKKEEIRTEDKPWLIEILVASQTMSLPDFKFWLEKYLGVK